MKKYDFITTKAPFANKGWIENVSNLLVHYYDERGVGFTAFKSDVVSSESCKNPSEIKLKFKEFCKNPVNL